MKLLYDFIYATYPVLALAALWAGWHYTKRGELDRPIGPSKRK